MSAVGGRGGSSGIMKNSQGKEVRRLNSVPDGWKPVENATTAPKGYTWYSNNKSRFSGEREVALVRDKRRRKKG